MRLLRVIYRILAAIIIPIIAIAFVLMCLSFTAVFMVNGAYEASNFTANVDLGDLDTIIQAELDKAMESGSFDSNSLTQTLMNYIQSQVGEGVDANANYAIAGSFNLDFWTNFFSVEGFSFSVTNSGTIYISTTGGSATGYIDSPAGILTETVMGESLFNESSLFYLLMIGTGIVGAYFAVMGSHSRWGILLSLACLATSTIIMILYTDYLTGPSYYLAIQLSEDGNGGGEFFEIMNVSLTPIYPILVLGIIDGLALFQAILTLTDKKASNLWPFQRRRKGEDDDGFHDYQKKPWSCPKCGAKHNHHPRCPHCGSAKPGSVPIQETATAYNPYAAPMPMFNPYMAMPQPMAQPMPQQQPAQQQVQQPLQQQPVQQQVQQPLQQQQQIQQPAQQVEQPIQHEVGQPLENQPSQEVEQPIQQEPLQQQVEQPLQQQPLQQEVEQSLEQQPIQQELIQQQPIIQENIETAPQIEDTTPLSSEEDIEIEEVDIEIDE